MPKNNRLFENRVNYDPKHKERMDPTLEKQLRTREHSLGPNPAFPEGDEQYFEEKVASKRFTDILKNYKKQYDVSTFDGPEVLMNATGYLRNCMQLEKDYHKELAQIAIDLVREEFDIPEEDLIINAEITNRIDSKVFRDNFRPRSIDVEFEDHISIESANKEVVKRRFVNAMIQGSAKKCSHLFHMVEDKIMDLNPRLNANYSKMMAAADLAYYLVNDTIKTIPGGIVEVEFPKNEGEPAVINAKAVAFPVLVHEIVKGVMEILSAHGLPEDPKITEFVIAKADFTGAENWDMRLGPGMWERFTDAIDYEDFDLKHHIYSDLVALPVDEFNVIMREILAGTNRGKRHIKEMADNIREEIRKDDLNDSLINDQFGDDDFFGPGELDDIDINDPDIL